MIKGRVSRPNADVSINERNMTARAWKQEAEYYCLTCSLTEGQDALALSTVPGEWVVRARRESDHRLSTPGTCMCTRFAGLHCPRWRANRVWMVGGR